MTSSSIIMNTNFSDIQKSYNSLIMKDLLFTTKVYKVKVRLGKFQHVYATPELVKTRRN